MELYDLDADPEMLRDLARVESERLAALRSEATAYFGQGERASGALEIPGPVARRLRQLGYAAADAPH